MNRSLFIVMLVVVSLFSKFGGAQTTFTGAISSIWSEPGNWDNGLPAPGNNATISSWTDGD